jgi:hypothetical protein
MSGREEKPGRWQSLRHWDRLYLTLFRKTTRPNYLPRPNRDTMVEFEAVMNGEGKDRP